MQAGKHMSVRVEIPVMGWELLTMCGICRVLNLHGQPLDAAAGQRMIDLPWHRGPDDNGSLVLQASISPAQDEVFSSSD
jgi:hypothetical protein